MDGGSQMRASTLDLPRLYSVEEVAAISGRTTKAIWSLRAKRRRGVRVGPRFTVRDRRLYVAEEDLVEWLRGVPEDVEVRS